MFRRLMFTCCYPYTSFFSFFLCCSGGLLTSSIIINMATVIFFLNMELVGVSEKSMPMHVFVWERIEENI